MQPRAGVRPTRVVAARGAGRSPAGRAKIRERGDVAIEFAPSARVLLAEGNRLHVHLITRALHEAGYEVHAVGTQAEAEAADPRNFDAVLVADLLEDGAGIELVRATASQASAPPVVMLVDPREPP